MQPQYDGSLSPRRLQRLREFVRTNGLGGLATAPGAAAGGAAAFNEAALGWQREEEAGYHHQAVASGGRSNASSAAASRAASLRASLKALHSRASSRAELTRHHSLQREGSSGSCVAAVAQLLAAEQAAEQAAAATEATDSVRSSVHQQDSSSSAAAASAIASLADAITAAAAATGRVPSCVRITLDPAGFALAANQGQHGQQIGSVAPPTAAAAPAGDRHPASVGGGVSSQELGAALTQLIAQCGSAAAAASGGVGVGGGGSHASSVAASVERLISKVEAGLSAPQVSTTQERGWKGAGGERLRCYCI